MVTVSPAGVSLSEHIELITQRLKPETEAWGNKSPTRGPPRVGDLFPGCFYSVGGGTGSLS